MSEREPRDIAKTGTWAVDTIAERMQQAPEPISRDEHGDGVGFSVAARPGGEGTRSVDLFSAAGQVVISSPDVDIFFRNAIAIPAKDGMRIDTKDGQSRGLFLRNGHVAVELLPFSPLEAREPPVSEQNTAGSSGVADMPEEWRIPAPVTPEDVADIALGQPKDSSIAAESGERQQRIKVDGFVATEPNMRPTPTGKPRVQFLVAEHPSVAEGEEEVTIYHRVYTLNKTAARVIEKGGLEKGKRVSVDGYLQPRIKKNRQNEDEEYNVVYALNIRTPQEPKPFTPKPPLPGREPAPKE